MSTGAKDATVPLWQGTAVLRVVTYLFAIGVVVSRYHSYQRPRLAVIVLVAMGIWSVVTVAGYLRRRWRRPWLAAADVIVTCGLMYSSVWILSETELATAAPLITTVWASVPAVAAGVMGGRTAGGLAGLLVAIATGLTRGELDTDVMRDAVLLIGSGFIIGMAATTGRRATANLERALRAEAATAERERLARSIHDSVLQVLARVRRRGSELGGEAAALAKLAGEQEIALRALVAAGPVEESEAGEVDLRGGLRVLASGSTQVSVPGTTVALPGGVADDLVDAVREALSNVAKHAGPRAKAWVLLEDLGTELVISVRDDGPGIPQGRLAAARRRVGWGWRSRCGPGYGHLAAR